MGPSSVALGSAQDTCTAVTWSLSARSAVSSMPPMARLVSRSVRTATTARTTSFSSRRFGILPCKLHRVQLEYESSGGHQRPPWQTSEHEKWLENGLASGCRDA